MNITVTGISREYTDLIADGWTMDIEPSYEYIIDFVVSAGESVIHSNVRIIHEQDLSFDGAEEMITKILSDASKAI